VSGFEFASLVKGGGSSRIAILAARPTHVFPIATRMRSADRSECAAMGHTPRQALRAGLATSSLAWTALVDGRPEAMFGLVVTSALGGEGRPWMLGSDAIYAHPRAMLRRGPRFLAAMFDATARLSNLVAADNARAIRLLRRWGFTIDTETMMIANTAFRLFHADRR
jgi:ribosomal protein S18 acetylase RimI-like enzyme